MPSELGIAFYPQVRSTVSYNICLQQTRRESKPLTPFSKLSSLEKRWRRALWGFSQKLPIPPGKLEPLTGLLDCHALIWVCPMCHFSEPVSIYVSFLCVFVLNKSVVSLENPQLFALGKSIFVWFQLFLSFYQHLFSAPEGMSTWSSFIRRPSWLCILQDKGIQINFQQSYPIDGFLSGTDSEFYWSREFKQTNKQTNTHPPTPKRLK